MTLFVFRHFLEDPAQDEPPSILEWVLQQYPGEDEPDIPPDVREQTFPKEMESTSTGRPCDPAHT